MRRSTRAGTTRALVLLGASTLLSATACDDELDPEPLVFTGDAVTLTGRVLGADESPVANAELDIWSADLPHTAPQRFGSTTTGADGRFRFEPMASDAVHSIVVRGTGSRHVYLVHVPASVSGTHAVDDLHIAPDRELQIVANCAGPLATDGSSDRPLPVRIEVEWLGHVLIRAQLLPPTIAVTDVAPAALSAHMPGHDYYSQPPPADARRFERGVQVPGGSHIVRVSGGCGDLTTRVDVPAEGAVAQLVLTLPPDPPE